MSGPLLTQEVQSVLAEARRAGATSVECSFDLGRSIGAACIEDSGWTFEGRRFPFPPPLKPRTIYHWADDGFEPVARYSNALIKLVPTPWGAPTFEIDGIKMLPTSRVSPYDDAAHKVRLVEPRGKVILDTCGGLGYFAAWCLEMGAARVLSFEKNPTVVWLRGRNPWSPAGDPRLVLAEQDVTQAIVELPDASVDAILHDPPRFGIAGELYSRAFYDQLARVVRRRGRLFHYTGSPNKHSGGRDLAAEVAARLSDAGFKAARSGDGLLAVRR